MDGSAYRIILSIHEPDSVIRGRLGAALSGSPDIEVVPEVLSPPRAPDPATRPVLLVAEELLRSVWVASTASRASIVVCSSHPGVERLRDCLGLGLPGYISKFDSPELIVMAIRSVAGGRSFISPSFSDAVRELVLGGTDGTLTESERMVLELLAGGHTNKEVAAALNISRRAVEAHRLHLMQTLGARSVAELVRLAFRRKLLTA